MNKKFEVNFEKNFHLVVDVEAENKEEAKEKALLYFNDKTKEELLNESQEGYFEHTYTDESEETKTSYIYALFDGEEQIDQTSLDEMNENLAYSIMVEDEGRNPKGLSVSLIHEVQE